MKLPFGPTDVSKELKELQFPSKQNKKLPRLPGNTIIHKRPINHAPVASPYAGPKAQKVVYVSRKTPVMSAVKRVKKFLQEIEKRALQSEGVNGVLDRRNGQQELQRKLDHVSERLHKDAEEVLVKASGRAMEQALRIGEWFRSREQEMICNVVVRTGSVSVIDDLVEKEIIDEDIHLSGTNAASAEQHETTVEMGETTIELFRHLDAEQAIQAEGELSPNEASSKEKHDITENGNGDIISQTGRKRKRKRKRTEYDADDVPEARIRWVKTVEVAISLRA